MDRAGCRRASAAVTCLEGAAESASDWDRSVRSGAHDVSMPAGAGAGLRRRQLPSKVSITSMRPPQHGQKRTGFRERRIRFARVFFVGCRCVHGEEDADRGQIICAHAAGQEPVMADAVEALGQHMRQEAADELACLKRHDLEAGRPLDPIVLVFEGDAGFVSGDQAPVRDGNPVRVARQVGQHLFWTGEWALGIDEPLDLFKRRDEGGEGIRAGKVSVSAKEAQLSGFVRGGKLFKHQPAEQLGKHQHWQEEAAAAGNPARAIQR